MSTFILGRRAEQKNMLSLDSTKQIIYLQKPKLRNIIETPNGYINYYNRTYILKNINYI